MKNYESQRENYSKGELVESNVPLLPIELFQKWMVNAINDHVREPNAMVLSTINDVGHPEARTVLLKEIFEESFVFYTNHTSDKAKQIGNNPNVSLLFLWKESQRQVRVTGVAERLSEEKSLDYFQKRPRGSQVGAWASPQSDIIPNRAFLEQSKREVENKFVGIQKLDKPDFWGGYKIKPSKIEFWQGRENRLHDRLVYQLQEDGTWTITRLAP